jgi:radical SAM enzyme (TIGR01210 family)
MPLALRHVRPVALHDGHHTPRGAIPRQIADATASIRTVEGASPAWVKLYNAGSFFDSRAVPPDDDELIADALGGFDRVVVESHPALVGERTWRFRDALDVRRQSCSKVASLEVAMGLETAHPEALEKLGKRVTLERFRQAAGRLGTHGVALRVFVLVNPPFVEAAEQDSWLRHSIAFAFECGASVVSLIPTRTGNGAMEELARMGLFVAPDLRDLERSAASGLSVARGRLLTDLWNLERFSSCSACFEMRRERLQRMNLEQRVLPPAECSTCGTVTPS